MSEYKMNPKLDLVLERQIDVPVEMVWKAWTTPEQLKVWFTPAPWKTIDCRQDLQPGGEFFTMMQSPEGQNFPNAGCFLEVIPNKKLTWTSAMESGFRPVAVPENGAGGMLFTASVILEPNGKGCKYKAVAMHSTEKDRKSHEDMGFEHGWGAALDQMIAMIKKM